MTTDITELAQQELAQLRAELSNQAIGSKDHLRKIALSLVDKLEKCRDREIRWLVLSDEKSKIITDQEEALEKAQTENTAGAAGMAESYETTISMLRSRIASLEESHAQVIQSRDHYKRMTEEGLKQLAESRTVTVKLPPELYTIGELIRTQDNRITDQPMFVVFQKREIIGSDEHSPSRICWVWDGEEVSELRAKRLEALYQDGRDTRGYDRYAMQEVDEFVTACFTENGCKDFLRQNGHNLRQPYIYACGSFRNNEYQLVRNWLAGLKREAE